MKYEKKETGDLRMEVNFVIEQADYETELDNKMKEHKKTAHFKGFRKGKVPMSMIKKMYGNSTLVDVINGKLGQEMDRYFEQENIKYIGEPMLAEGHEPLDVDINQLGDYTFTFDLGLRPDFEVQGVSAEDSFEKYKIQVDDKTVQDEIDVLRRRNGKQDLVTEDIEESDILTLEAVELEGKKEKEKGWETGFTIMVDSISDEKLKKQVLKKKAGETFDFNIYKLEKERDEAFVKKYFLNLDENEEKEIGENFRFSIKEVRRLVPAEMDEQFFTTNFGEEIKDEEAAKAFIKEQLEKFYDNESMQLVFRNMMDTMIEKTEFEMPKEFLERWLKSQDKNKDLPEEEFQKQFDTFLKEMRWSLIKSSLTEKMEVKVEEQDIQQRLYAKAQNYMNQQMQGFSDPNMLNEIYGYLAKDRNQVNQAADEVATDRIFGKLKDEVKLIDKKISLDEFKEVVTKLNEEIEAEKKA
jgi:trigger factor